MTKRQRRQTTGTVKKDTIDPRIEAMLVLGISNLNASRILYLLKDRHVQEKYNLKTVDDIIGYLFRIAMDARSDLRFIVQVHDDQAKKAAM